MSLTRALMLMMDTNLMEYSTKGNNAWLFQRMYYHAFDWTKKTDETYALLFFKRRLSQLTNTSLANVVLQNPNTRIRMVTSYPGLVTGVGVKHETGSKGELKLGFEFDYTSGAPIIRGHSVKGKLRSAFPQHHRPGVKYKYEKAYLIHCIINNEECTESGFTTFSDNDALYRRIVAIEEEIFDGKFNGQLLSNYKQDTFFDAALVEPAVTNEGKKYVGIDSITPHGENPLKNPNPIPFLKVIPGVRFEFRFALHNNGLLDAGSKRTLFERLLSENGLGAKTNVGYGQLMTESEYENVFARQHDGTGDEIITGPLTPSQFVETIPLEAIGQLKANSLFIGRVAETQGEYCIIHFEVGNKACVIRKKFAAVKNPNKERVSSLDEIKTGMIVQVHVNNDYTIGSNLNCGVKLTNS